MTFIAMAFQRLHSTTSHQQARIGGGLLLLATFEFALPHRIGEFWGWVLLALGGVVLWLALRRSGDSLLEADSPAESRPIPGLRLIHWLALSAGLILLCLFMQMQRPPFMSWHFGMGWPLEISYHLQFMTFAGGLLLFVWGVGGGLSTAWLRRREVWIVAGITLLALVLRLIAAGETIRGLIDELNTVAEVLALQQFPDVKLLWPMTGISPFPWFFAYGQYLSVEIMGNTLAGLRGASAVTGALAVPAAYLLARSLFDRRTAVIAALLLATFPPHLHFSRLALLNIADSLFGVAAVGLLLHGFRRGGRMPFILAGVCLGLTQYFYEGGRLFFPLFLVLILGWLVVTGQRRLIHWRGLGLSLLVAVVTSIPLYYTWLVIDAPLAGRMGDAGLGLDYWRTFLLSGAEDGWLGIQLDQVRRAFLVYVGMPETSVFYGGQTALILPMVVPFFLLGLTFTLFRPRRPAFILVLWVIGTSLGNGLLMLNSAATTRYLGVMPILMVLTAAGVRYGLPLLFPTDSIRLAFRRVNYRTALVGLVAILAVGQAIYYFGPHLSYFNWQFRAARPVLDVDDAVLRAAELPAGTHVILIPSYYFDLGYAGEFLHFLTPDKQLTTIMNIDLTEDWLRDLPAGVDYAFFIDPQDHTTYQLIDRVFHLEAPVYSPHAVVPDDDQFIMIYAASDSQNLVQGDD